MARSEIPCLSLAIDRLMAAEAEHFAIWVLQAPSPGAYVHYDRIWPESLTQAWNAWQEMFSLRGLPNVPYISPTYGTNPPLVLPPENHGTPGQTMSYSSRLMQHLGISLWQWVFDGPIQSSLDQSYGMALGQGKALRLRLEIRDPNLIALPWEIMQPQAGKQAISLSQQLLFSRTTSDVDPLPALPAHHALRILLVLGQDTEAGFQALPASRGSEAVSLNLEQEAAALAHTLESCGQAIPQNPRSRLSTPCVDTLLQPSPAELVERLESGAYNIFFYAGHGIPAPDGGLLFLQPNTTLSGTELAQVLTRCQVTLAVFNACWGAQPDQDNHQAIPRSSLSEVLIHHGVPAVLGMRDSIANQEALSFIQAFTQALAERRSLDQAVAIARQHLLTLYKFNQPAWTLPVLYMHPEFDGELIKPLEEGITELPVTDLPFPPPLPASDRRKQIASLRAPGSNTKIWPIRGGLMRVGRKDENDLVIAEQWVSQRHAEIFCRDITSDQVEPVYFLRDFSRYGTWMVGPSGWQKVHHQEVPLKSGVQLKFGSSEGQTLEFVIENV